MRPARRPAHSRPTAASSSAARVAAAGAGRRCRRRRCARRRGAGTARSPGTPCRCAAAPAARGVPPASLTTAAVDARCWPAAMRSKPPMQRSAVVLPQPEGPSRQQISPLASDRSRSAKVGACRSDAPRRVSASTGRNGLAGASRSGGVEVRGDHGGRPYTARHAARRARAHHDARRVLVAVPVLSVGVNVFAPGTGATWAHLAATVLPEYIGATLVLCLGVGLGSVLLGVGSAWLVTHLDFRCRRSLRVGAGPAAGDAGLRHGLRLRRPAAVRRPGADGAARGDRLDPRATTGSPTCAASAARS